MATSEPLVPTGLPHGERQQITEAMDVAGLPRSVPSPAASSPSPTPAVGGGGSLRDFDVLAGRDPSGVIAEAPPVAAVTGFKMRVQNTQNAAMRYYFAKVGDYLED